MVHTSISIDLIVARVIRNTRIQDTSYVMDMFEWIPEAMGYMKTKMELSPKCLGIPIQFYKGAMPCNISHLQAVCYNGSRISYGTAIRKRPNAQIDNIGLFTSIIKPIETAANTIIWSSDIVIPTQVNTDHWYNIELDYINTSLMDGTLTIYYLGYNTDTNGIPLIPDNENYKEALYYYCRAKMIGCGYKDSTYSEKELMERFEKYASRAIAQIRYPSTDIVQQRVEALTRLIPPANYWESFFNHSPETYYTNR